MIELTDVEQEKLIEVLTCIEDSFEADLDALAQVFDNDAEWVDVEVELSDGLAEQFKIERCLLSQEISPLEIAESIN